MHFSLGLPAARVALVKCRDLHWAMMAHLDQKDTSLASLRMLIVADGANPCKDPGDTPLDTGPLGTPP